MVFLHEIGHNKINLVYVYFIKSGKSVKSKVSLFDTITKSISYWEACFTMKCKDSDVFALESSIEKILNTGEWKGIKEIETELKQPEEQQ